MGKPLDQLEGGDQPVQSTPAREAQLVAKFIEELKGMQRDGRYEFALSTIEGILESVQRMQRLTEGQRRAITNIQAGVQRREDAREDRHRRQRRWTGGY